MDMLVADREIGRRHAQSVEDVGVAASAGAEGRRGQADRTDRRCGSLHDGGIIGMEIGRVDQAVLERRCRPVIDSRRFDRLPHGGDLRLQLGAVDAAGFGLQANVVADDIRGAAALEPADIGRRLMVDSSQRHARNRLGGDLDGADAVFRIDACMRRAAVDMDEDFCLGRSRYRDAPDRSVGIERIAVFGAQLAAVQRPGSGEARFLSDRNDELDFSMRNSVLLQQPDRLQHRGQARLVVASENRRAVAAQIAVVVQTGLDADARLHRIHMGGEEDDRRLDAWRSLQRSEQIVRAITGGGGRIVLLDFKSKRGKSVFQLLADRAFIAGFAVDLDKLHELLYNPVFMDHFPNASFRSASESVTIAVWVVPLMRRAAAPEGEELMNNPNRIMKVIVYVVLITLLVTTVLSSIGWLL
ncbi:hypothetical protein BN871_CZ_00140 [Paenibacillus sp. P22]|nr:hypothetical protein BN871_CZ_00140 [Paenibacillus sp. P22]